MTSETTSDMTNKTTSATNPTPAPPVESRPSLAREFGWALVYAALGFILILLGSAGPQFIYAGF
ncbi:MAG: hypothetical protein IT350_06515 [Deltaproteobacteria bacterium]|nr:hypothetical protein [Deltaproteobacteria bacterium]